MILIHNRLIIENKLELLSKQDQKIGHSYHTRKTETRKSVDKGNTGNTVP